MQNYQVFLKEQEMFLNLYNYVVYTGKLLMCWVQPERVNLEVHHVLARWLSNTTTAVIFPQRAPYTFIIFMCREMRQLQGVQRNADVHYSFFYFIIQIYRA